MCCEVVAQVDGEASLHVELVPVVVRSSHRVAAGPLDEWKVFGWSMPGQVVAPEVVARLVVGT